MTRVFTVILQGFGWLLFLGCTVIFGARLRRNPSQKAAEGLSRILHFVFWWAVAPPAGLAFFYPGLARLDRALGLGSLPRKPAVFAVGAIGILAGLYLIIVSNLALRRLGEGANAFRLTKRLVTGDIYERTRNPMSLGVYLVFLGTGLLTGSIYLTLGVLLVFIPGHIFYLKSFEEYELELRMGQPYLEYKRRVPFLLPRIGSGSVRHSE